MKLSLNWLKRYLKITYTPEKIAEMLTIIGLEVEGIDKVESIKGGLKGVVVGEVVTCEKHPDADRLSVTTVNVGSGDHLWPPGVPAPAESVEAWARRERYGALATMARISCSSYSMRRSTNLRPA